MQAPELFSRHFNTRGERLTAWRPDCTHGTSCCTLSSTGSMTSTILGTSLQRMGFALFLIHEFCCSDLYWIFKSISDTLNDSVNVTCWNLAACVASLRAEEDQAEPSSYPSRSGIRSSANYLAFPFTQWGSKRIGEKVVRPVRGSNRNSGELTAPRGLLSCKGTRLSGHQKAGSCFQVSGVQTLPRAGSWVVIFSFQPGEENLHSLL